MGRIYAIGGKQHSGKTVSASMAAPEACAFVVDPVAHRAMVETKLGLRPGAALTMLHEAGDNLLGVAQGETYPKLRTTLEGRMGSMTKPGKVLAKSPTWAASVAAAEKAGVDKDKVFFWSPPSAHEGEASRIWLPHSEILIDDWQFIVANIVDVMRPAILDKNGDIDGLKLGAVIGTPIKSFFIWLQTTPLNVILTSHLKKPGKVRDGVEIDAGSIVMPTRTGAGEILATFEMVTLMRPAAATVERVSSGDHVGVKVTGGKVGSELDVISDDDELDFDAWVAKPATVLEGLEELSNLFVHYPAGDPGINNWLTRDRSGVLWAGGCPGAIYGLYVGAGKARDYPFSVPQFIQTAAKEAVSAKTAEDLYRIVAAALRGDAAFGDVWGAEPVAVRRRLALQQWGLHEAHAAWVAASHWRAKETALLSRFV